MEFFVGPDKAGSFLAPSFSYRYMNIKPVSTATLNFSEPQNDIASAFYEFCDKSYIWVSIVCVIL